LPSISQLDFSLNGPPEQTRRTDIPHLPELSGRLVCR
jgi:hypothetical protein